MEVTGRRIAKAYDGTVVAKYVYDGPSLIAEYDGNDNLLRKYLYGPGVDQPICMIDVNDANAVYYHHFDGLGSVVALRVQGVICGHRQSVRRSECVFCLVWLSAQESRSIVVWIPWVLRAHLH
jgi:hypothetical protein